MKIQALPPGRATVVFALKVLEAIGDGKAIHYYPAITGASVFADGELIGNLPNPVSTIADLRKLIEKGEIAF